MTSILTRAKLALAVLAVAAAPAGAAFAQDSASVPGGGTSTGLVSAAPAVPYTGTVTFGGMMPPTNGGQGEPESANSMPPGFENGTPAMQRRQELQRYWAEQARHAQLLNTAVQKPNGGI